MCAYGRWKRIKATVHRCPPRRRGVRPIHSGSGFRYEILKHQSIIVRDNSRQWSAYIGLRNACQWYYYVKFIDGVHDLVSVGERQSNGGEETSLISGRLRRSLLFTALLFLDPRADEFAHWFRIRSIISSISGQWDTVHGRMRRQFARRFRCP